LRMGKALVPVFFNLSEISKTSGSVPQSMCTALLRPISPSSREFQPEVCSSRSASLKARQRWSIPYLQLSAVRGAPQLPVQICSWTLNKWPKLAPASASPFFRRRSASSVPGRCGMATTKGFDIEPSGDAVKLHVNAFGPVRILRACTHKPIWSKAAGNVRHSTLCGLNSDLARGPRRAHVWTAPAVQGKSDYRRSVRVPSWIRPSIAAILTAGPDVIR
jgi:hypothetical protein